MVSKLLEKKKDKEWPKELLADDNHQNQNKTAERIHANTKAKVLLSHNCSAPLWAASLTASVVKINWKHIRLLFLTHLVPCNRLNHNYKTARGLKYKVELLQTKAYVTCKSGRQIALLPRLPEETAAFILAEVQPIFFPHQAVWMNSHQVPSLCHWLGARDSGVEFRRLRQTWRVSLEMIRLQSFRKMLTWARQRRGPLHQRTGKKIHPSTVKRLVFMTGHHVCNGIVLGWDGVIPVSTSRWMVLVHCDRGGKFLLCTTRSLHYLK